MTKRVVIHHTPQASFRAHLAGTSGGEPPAHPFVRVRIGADTGGLSFQIGNAEKIQVSLDTALCLAKALIEALEWEEAGNIPTDPPRAAWTEESPKEATHPWVQDWMVEGGRD